MLPVAILLAVAAFAPNSLGADKPVVPGLRAQAVGLVDPGKIQEKFPDYIRLMELKKAYDAEMKTYTDYMQGQLQSNLAELNRQRDAESEGKSAEEKKTIAAKYAASAQAKQNESSVQVQAKYKTLQEKLNAATAQADAKVTAAIEAVCAEKGLTIVFNKTAIYLGGIDVTANVIAKGQVKK